MKFLNKNFSVEITDGGDIIIGKDGQKYMTFKDNGTLELQGSTGIWAGLGTAKVSLNDYTQSFSDGDNLEIYRSGTKLVFACKDSNQDRIWFYMNFDAPDDGLRPATSEP